jgi:hypothetical protein
MWWIDHEHDEKLHTVLMWRIFGVTAITDRRRRFLSMYSVGLPWVVHKTIHLHTLVASIYDFLLLLGGFRRCILAS